jgi:hypothetical protein
VNRCVPGTSASRAFPAYPVSLVLLVIPVKVFLVTRVIRVSWVYRAARVVPANPVCPEMAFPGSLEFPVSPAMAACPASPASRGLQGHLVATLVSALAHLHTPP